MTALRRALVTGVLLALLAFPFASRVQPGKVPGIAYGADLADGFRKAPVYVEILKGAWPGDLPIDQATRIKRVLNLRTAQALGMTLPPAVLERADEIIK
jgi:ABC-type uncharacterized transport system substrate-binding protein